VEMIIIGHVCAVIAILAPFYKYSYCSHIFY
jgi:hypothetical protein